jgi:hypothetical protein
MTALEEGALPRTGERSTASYRAYVMITGLAPTFVSLLALGARSELAFESPRRCPVAPSIALCRSSDPDRRSDGRDPSRPGRVPCLMGRLSPLP